MYVKLIEEDINFLLHEKLGIPFYLYVSLSNLCNANCVFCNVHEEKDKNSIIDLQKIIPELKTLGTKYIHFMGGGEPLVNREIWELFRVITEAGMNIALTTNGFALDPEKIQRIKTDNLQHVFFSVDSHLPEIHNNLRRLPGLWEKATDNIRLLKESMPQVKVVINHLLNRSNILFFEKMIKLRDEVPFDYINPIFIKDYSDLFFEDTQVAHFIEHLSQYYESAEKKGVNFLSDNLSFATLSQREAPGISKRMDHQNENESCYFPYLSAYLDCPTAQVFPCDCTIHRDPVLYRCGSLLDNSFSEIWNGPKMKDLRSKLRYEKMSCKLNCDLSNVFINNIIRERIEK